MKYFIVAAICCLLMTSVSAEFAQSFQPASDFVAIRTEADLRNLASAINNGTAFVNSDGVNVGLGDVPFAEYRLMNAIPAFAGGQFPGIGTRARPFRGSFISNNRNFTINVGAQNPVGTGAWGLFSYVSGNVTLSYINVQGNTAGANSAALGSLVGTVLGGDVVIRYTHSTMIVAATMGVAGGIIGSVEQGRVTIHNSTTANVTVTGMGYVGGIIGSVASAEVIIRQEVATIAGLPSPRFSAVNLAISGSAVRGFAVGRISNNSEVGFMGLGTASPTAPTNIFQAVNAITDWAGVTLAGYISSNSVFNGINIGVVAAPAVFNAPFYQGSGEFNWVNINTSARNITLSDIGLGSILDNPEFALTRANIDITIRYGSSNLLLTFSGFAPPVLQMSSPVAGQAGEFSDLIAHESGTISGFVNHRLGSLISLSRPLNLTLNLLLARIVTRDLILFNIDNYTEVNLLNHFETLDHPFKAYEQFRFRITTSRDGRTREVPVRQYQFIDVRAGEFTVHVFIYVPDRHNLHPGSGVLGYYRFSTASFTLTLYNSAGQAFDPGGDNNGGYPPTVTFIILIYVLTPLVAVAVLGISVFVILRKRRNTKQA